MIPCLIGEYVLSQLINKPVTTPTPTLAMHFSPDRPKNKRIDIPKEKQSHTNINHKFASSIRLLIYPLLLV